MSKKKTPKKNKLEIEKLEMLLLFEGLFRRYGYDFRNYSYASARRRVKHLMASEGIKTIAEVQHRVLYDVAFADRLLKSLSVNVTEMFRDPGFYRAIRDIAVPALRNFMNEHGHYKTWHAGCSTGEEIFSMAILMHEEKILDQCSLYATDFNKSVLVKAEQAIISLDSMQKNIENYQQSGGYFDFANYYVAQYGAAQIDKTLLKTVVFSNHNLVTDGSFGEMQMIVCRNVLIYFNQTLQDRVFQLFDDSLSVGGLLCLGSKESLRFSSIMDKYETLSTEQRIYRKCR